MKPNKRWWLGAILGATVLSVGIGHAQRVSEPEVRLQEALRKEQVEGDLSAAIKLYERIAADQQAPRSVAAQALLDAGRCYEKLGRREAQRAYERIVQQFSDQGAITTEARSRLDRLRTGQGSGRAGLSQIKLATIGGVSGGNMSSDGRFVVLYEGGLNLADLNGGELRRLPFDPLRPRKGKLAEVISPDGKRIAYYIESNGIPALRFTSPDDSNPRVLRLLLSSQRVIRGVRLMDWSRDGRSLAGLVYWQDPPAGNGRDHLADLATIDVATGNVRVLQNAVTAAGPAISPDEPVRFSPDGEYLAFGARGSLFVVRVDGTGAERLSIGDGRVFGPTGWLPDGRAILFVRESGGVLGLWAVPVEGGRAHGTPVVLMRGLGDGVHSLGVTASGSLIYRVDATMRRSYIVDLSKNPGARSSVDDSDHAWVHGVRWSPDARYLSYVVLPLKNRPENRLMVRELASGKEREILRWEGGLWQGSSWSPDGQSILIARTDLSDGGVSRVDRVNASTGTVELLYRVPAQLGFPRLSPDGRYLYFWINGEVERIDLQTKERIKTGMATQAGFDLSSDGTRIALVGRDGIKVRSTDGSGERVVLKLRPDEGIDAIAWKPGSDTLFLAIQNAEATQLFELDTRSASEPRPLEISIKSLGDIAVHPNGRQIAFVDNDLVTEFWKIDGLSEAFAAAVRGSTASSATTPRPGRSK